MWRKVSKNPVARRPNTAQTVYRNVPYHLCICNYKGRIIDRYLKIIILFLHALSVHGCSDVPPVVTNSQLVNPKKAYKSGEKLLVAGVTSWNNAPHLCIGRRWKCSFAIKTSSSSIIRTSRRLDSFLHEAAQNFEVFSNIQKWNKKIKNLQRLMSFSRPIQRYHFHVDPIWPDGTFKELVTSLCYYVPMFYMIIYIVAHFVKPFLCISSL